MAIRLNLLRGSNSGRNIKESTALHTAARCGNALFLRLMARKNLGELKGVDSKGNNLMHKAMEAKRLEIMRIIHGLCPSLLDMGSKKKESPLDIAFRNENQEIKKLCVRFVFEKESDERSQMYKAVIAEDLFLIRTLHVRDPNLIFWKKGKETLMHLAILKNNAQLIDLIYELDPDSLLYKDICGNNLIHYAIENDKLEAVRTLGKFLVVDKDGNGVYLIQQTNDFDQTPMDVAVLRDNPQAIEILHEEDIAILKNNSQVNLDLVLINRRFLNGETPLHLAIKERKLKAVRKLIELEAQLTTRIFNIILPMM
jgi:ankyrin repeat protein